MTARRHLRRLIVLIVVLVVGLTALGSVALLLLFRQVAALDARLRRPKPPTPRFSSR